MLRLPEDRSAAAAAALPLASGDTLVVRHLSGNPAPGHTRNPIPYTAPAAAAPAPGPPPAQPPPRSAPAAPSEPPQRRAPAKPVQLGFSAPAAPSDGEERRSAPAAEAGASGAAMGWGALGSAVRNPVCMCYCTSTNAVRLYELLWLLRLRWIRCGCIRSTG